MGGTNSDGIDIEYLDSLKDRISLQIRSEFGEPLVHGETIVRDLPEDASVCYSLLHKSHMDYIILGYETFSKNLPYPRIVAGKNLIVGAIGTAIKHIPPMKVDLERAGALIIDRKWGSNGKKRNESEDNALSKAILEVISKGGCTAEFSEAKSRTEKNNKGRSKKSTGRSKDGRVRNLYGKLIRSAWTASRDNEICRDVFIVPTSISYEIVPETFEFSYLQNISKYRDSKNPFARLYGNLWYSVLEINMFTRQLFNDGRGPLYVNFGEPVEVKGCNSCRELLSEVQNRVFKAYIPPRTAIISTALSEGITSGSKIVDRCRSLEEGINCSVKKKHSREDYWNSLHQMSELGIIEPVCCSSAQIINIRKNMEPVIRYYANTIEHLLD